MNVSTDIYSIIKICSTRINKISEEIRQQTVSERENENENNENENNENIKNNKYWQMVN